MQLQLVYVCESFSLKLSGDWDTFNLRTWLETRYNLTGILNVHSFETRNRIKLKRKSKRRGKSMKKDLTR